MNSLLQDLRYGARMLLKKPGFTLIAVITLALGIGANTAIFSFVNALFLKPLGGVANPEQLVQVGRTYENRESFSSSSYPDYIDYRDQNTVMSGLALKRGGAFHLSTGQQAERVDGELVSGNYFQVLGVKAAAGRLITPADAQVEGASPVAVLSHRLWQQRFGGDPNIVGKTVSLNAHSYTVVGVASEEFDGVEVGAKVDVWAPITMWRQGDPMMANFKIDFFSKRDSTWLDVFGRLKPGVTIEQARAEFTIIAQRLAQAYPKTNSRIGVRLTPGLGMDPTVREEARSFAFIPMAAVGIVLLIACANVAGLLLARANARQKEIGIRLALGAGRARIVRQLLTESLMLALSGGLFGLIIGAWLNEWLRSALPESYRGLSLKLDLAVDWRVFTFTLAVSVLTGVLFGLVPAMQASKPDLVPVLKDLRLAGRRAGGAGLRSALVVTQVALSLALLIAAGLCVRTLRNARAIDTGFEMDRVLTARIDLGRQNYDETQGKIFYQQLIERIRALPGVQAASLAYNLPFTGQNYGTSIYLDDQQSKRVQIYYNVVTPGYFETMKIPLLLGRYFSEQDGEQAPPVAIINETMARSVWPNEVPIGKRFAMVNPDGSRKQIEVIGVTRDVAGSDPFEQTRVFLYLPLLQSYQTRMTLLLRAGGKPELLTAAVQREVGALDKNLPVYKIVPLSSYLTGALTPQRLAARLISGFGLLAVLLAGIGLYGVMAFAIAQRTQEIGIRMALGAQTSDVLKLMLRQGMALALLGVAIGLMASFALTRLMKGLLFGVSATDPLTFAGVALLLALVAFLACWIPARRATKVDPMIALRCE